jgi:hypothetical protein
MKIIALAILLLILGCISDNEYKCYHYLQWLIPGDEIPIRHQPKEVRDSIFSNVTDTVISNSSGMFGQLEVCKFNKNGNIIESSSQKPGFTIIQKSVFTDTGYSNLTYSLLDNKASDTLGFTVHPYKDGKFIYTDRDKDEKSQKLVIFSNNGNTRIIETTDTFNGKKIITIETGEFKNGKLQKITVKKEDKVQQLVYHYSANFLDSVVFLVDGKWVSIRSYIYNKQGDPVFRLEKDGNGKILQAHAVSYVYDEKGNWIKKLEKEVVSDPYLPQPSHINNKQMFRGYSLIVRTIVY